MQNIPFLTIPRVDAGYRPKEERVRDFNPAAREQSEENLRKQALRCMNCGIPFCHGMGCPLGNVIPEFNRAATRGEWKKALDILLETSPFPEFTSVICPALCEGSCVNGLDGDSVTIREIEHFIIENGYANGWVRPVVPMHRLNRSVAVIGAGPAGLSAAEELNRKGINVTVYERAQRPGGLMRFGIPDFKLDKKLIDRRIALMKEEGIAFENGIEVGEDVSPEYIFRKHDALVLTCGSRAPRDLKVKGRELSGIHFAVDFLTQQNRLNAGDTFSPDPTMNAKNKRVVVVGGGDTGSDCIGTAIRQGAVSVTQIEIMPKSPMTRAKNNPWPEWPRLFKETSSHKEGCERRWCINTEEAICEDGHVKALRCVQVEWKRDANGRMSFAPVAGSEFVLEADLVLLAMGFTGHAIPKIVSALSLQTNDRGAIVRDANGKTSADNVYIAGDVATGPSLVVRAIADGRRVADALAGRLAQ